MGKRKRRNEVNAGGGPKPVKDKGRDGTADSSVGNDNVRTRNKKEVTASPANKENLINSELKAVDSSQKASPGAVVKAGEGRKLVTGKAAARRSKDETSSQGGELGAKKTFSWSPAQEIIALSELLKSVNSDADQSLDKSNIDWEQLATRVGQRLDHNLTRTQIYEKARRLKERYTRTRKKGKLKSFKNEGDEKMYNLSQQIWGSSGAIRSQQEEEWDLLSGNLEKKFCDVDNIHKGDSLPDDPEVEIPGVTSEEEGAPQMHQKDPVSLSEPKQGTTAAHQQANPDLNLASQSKIHAIEGDIQKTFEVFHAEHQALLKELEKSCATVLQDMQVKFLSMMNNSIRGSQVPWIGGGGGVPSFDFITQASLSWDKLVDKCVSTSINKPAVFENLYEQWQQQRLQELKLTSMKLQLMLEDCKMQQEKLEKQVLKS